jgi:hypothetical protein
VVVLVDAASFGGLKGTDRQQANLLSQGIPVFRIANHDDLSTALRGGAGKNIPAGNTWWKEIK